MTGVTESTQTAGLVALTGRGAGGRTALRLPVTLIGAGPACDVRVPGAADIHCVIVASPAGPVVRSLDPAATRVNGTPTAAGLLADGDTLAVGRCEFRFHWPVSPAGPHAVRTDAGTPKADKAERKALAAERAELQREREIVAAARADVDADADQVRADIAAAKAALAADRDRFAAETAAAEAELSTLFQLLDARTAAAAADRANFDANRAEAIDKHAGLLAEVAGLEARAGHLRDAIDALEATRPRPPAVEPMGYAPVPLARPSAKSADELVADLLERERELTRERKAVAAARARADALAGDLADARGLLDAERARWTAAAAQTAAELEYVARELAGEELKLVVLTPAG